MADQLAWTDAGRAELARRRATRFVAPKQPAAMLEALVEEHGPRWQQWAANTDANGKRLAQLAAGWQPTAKADVEQLALLVALLGGGSDVQDASLAAFVVDVHGISVALRVIVATWPLWRDREKWLVVRAPDDLGIHDTSVSWGKRNFAECVGARVRADKKLAAAAAKAIAKIWPRAPRYAKTALAYAADDPVRGAEIARELLAHDDPYPHYPFDVLPHFIRDPKLVVKLMKASQAEPSLQMLDNLGVAAIPLIHRTLIEARDKWTRQRMMEVAANVKSTKIARELASHVGQAPYAAIVRDYFSRHRDLLAKMMRDPELQYHRDDLAKL